MKSKSWLFIVAVSIVAASGIFNNLISSAEAQSYSRTKIIQPTQKKNTVASQKSTVQKSTKPVQTKSPAYLTAADVKQIAVAEIESYINQGKLVTSTPEVSFEKLNSLNRSYSDDAPGFQPYYIPAAALSGAGTFFSATNIGADSLSGNSGSMTTLSVSDASTLNSLTVNALASFAGGLSLATPPQGNIINSDSGAFLSAGGDWTNASSKDYKENFTPLDPDDVLAKINSLPITRWNYKKEASSTTHIGPLAEDFYSAFQVGGSDKNISTIDPSGVALIGIQALTKRVAELEKKLQQQTCSIPTNTIVVPGNTSSITTTTVQSTILPQTDGITTTTPTSTIDEIPDNQSSSTPMVEAVPMADTTTSTTSTAN